VSQQFIDNGLIASPEPLRSVRTRSFTRNCLVVGIVIRSYEEKQTMKKILEVTMVSQVEVELPDELGAADLHLRPDTKQLTLMHSTVELPFKVVFQTVAISPPLKPRPDEFRCDSCGRECSNDEKYINDDGDELCKDCKQEE